MGALTPTIGRIVHARTKDSSDVQSAIITRVFNADVDGETGCLGVVNLKVMPDGAPPFDQTSVRLFHTPGDAERDGAAIRCWWPERT